MQQTVEKLLAIVCHTAPVVFVDYQRIDYGQDNELLQYYFVFLREKQAMDGSNEVLSRVLRLCRVRRHTHTHTYTHTHTCTSHNYVKNSSEYYYNVLLFQDTTVVQLHVASSRGINH